MTPVKDVHLRHLDLFSGIGGFALASRWAGIETMALSEIEPYACAVLAHQFPQTRNLGDVRKLCRRTYECNLDPEMESAWCPRCQADFADCACIGTDEFIDCYGSPDIITAGFPCQDVSCNSHTGTGTAGERSGLVFEATRVANELRPAFLLLENVAALKTRGADQLLAELEGLGYAAESFVVGARHAGGEHRRKRAWIAAYDTTLRIQGVRTTGFEESRPLGEPLLPLRDRDGQWQVEPDLRRTDDGTTRWMDRLATIGNAVVPQIPVHFLDWMRDVLGARRYCPTAA